MRVGIGHGTRKEGMKGEILKRGMNETWNWKDDAGEEILEGEGGRGVWWRIVMEMNQEGQIMHEIEVMKPTSMYAD